MNFEWDGRKSDRCLDERGFDFDYVSRIFQGRTSEAVDNRKDYGEVRIKAIGCIDGEVFTVVYTERQDARRIVSARKAHRRERQQWLSSANPL